jgi:hypothetical protein
MPSWFPSWTNCCAPQSYYKVVWAGAAAGGLGGTGLATLAALGIAGAWLPGVAALFAAFCLAGIAFCTWWLNVRLICLGGDRSAVGAIYSIFPPNPSFNPVDFGSYDTDYSFDLLLWPFQPEVTLGLSFVGNDAAGQHSPQEWDPASVAALWSDTGFWNKAVGGTLVTASGQPVQEVQNQVNLILPQQSMASLGLSFTGQPSNDDGNIGGAQPFGGSDQQFLLHCEIEGSGVYDLRAFLWVLFGIFSAAAAVSVIPVL